MPGQPQPELPGERMRRRTYPLEARGERDELRGTLGFRLDAEDGLEDLLDRSSALVLKAHFALWSRAFAETDGELEAEAEVTLAQFCDDLGYARLQNGAHRPESKRQAARLLALLGSVELDLRYRAPDGSAAELTGPLWEIRLEGETQVTARFRVGPWFHQPNWRRFNAAVGLAPAGLMELRTDRDAWAIRFAAYLAVLARINGYRPLRLRASTLLRKTGLQSAEARNPARMREKLERALERLEEAGILGGWDWEADGAEPDMDDPATLRALAAEAERWQERRLLLRWPRTLRARESALDEARRQRRSRPRRTPAGV